MKKNIKSEYNHSDFGEIEIKEIPRVKKNCSSTFVKFMETIPHVTHHDEIDITEIEEFRNKLKDLVLEKKKNNTISFYN